jgi:hypothetical protein
MTGRVIHYSEPVSFHKAMPGATSVVIMTRDAVAASHDDDESRATKPKKEAEISFRRL